MHIGGSQLSMINTDAPHYLWDNRVKSAILGKKDGRDRTKVMIECNGLSEGRKGAFKYCQGPYIDIYIDFHQL